MRPTSAALTVIVAVSGCDASGPGCDSPQARRELMNMDFSAIYLQAIGNSKAYQQERGLIDRQARGFELYPYEFPADNTPEPDHLVAFLEFMKTMDSRYLATAVTKLDEFEVIGSDTKGQRASCAVTLAVESGDSRSTARIRYDVLRVAEGQVRVEFVDSDMASKNNDGFVARVFAYPNAEDPAGAADWIYSTEDGWSPPVGSDGIVHCQTVCADWTCVRTYLDGHQIQFPATKIYNDASGEWEYQTGGCQWRSAPEGFILCSAAASGRAAGEERDGNASNEAKPCGDPG